MAFIRPDNNKFSQLCYDIAIHRYFEIIILLAIVLNAFGMACKHIGMSKQEMHAIEQFNYIFTGFFFLEAVVKLIAFGRRYFKDSWNVFDFIILTFSLILIVAGRLWTLGIFSTATS